MNRTVPRPWLLMCVTCGGSGEICVGWTSATFHCPPEPVEGECPVCEGEGEISEEEFDEAWGREWPSEDDAAEMVHSRITEPYPEPYDIAGDR